MMQEISRNAQTFLPLLYVSDLDKQLNLLAKFPTPEAILHVEMVCETRFVVFMRISVG